MNCNFTDLYTEILLHVIENTQTHIHMYDIYACLCRSVMSSMAERFKARRISFSYKRGRKFEPCRRAQFSLLSYSTAQAKICNIHYLGNGACIWKKGNHWKVLNKLYVCVHVCVCVRVYTCVSAHMHLHVCMFVSNVRKFVCLFQVTTLIWKCFNRRICIGNAMTWFDKISSYLVY